MELIREIKEDISFQNPKDIYKYLEEFKNQDREFFIVIGLDTKNKPVYREINSIGSLNQTIVHPREVFKKAILMSCNSIIVAHNHPSGDIEPSDEDIKITKQLIKAGNVLDISVLDHLIITENNFNSIINKI